MKRETMLNEVDAACAVVEEVLEKKVANIISLHQVIIEIKRALLDIKGAVLEHVETGRLRCPACTRNEMSKGCPVCNHTGYIDEPSYE